MIGSSGRSTTPKVLNIESITITSLVFNTLEVNKIRIKAVAIKASRAELCQKCVYKNDSELTFS